MNVNDGTGSDIGAPRSDEPRRPRDDQCQYFDRYLGGFCLGNAETHERYNAQEIRGGNASADHYYRQELKKIPQWAYTDREWGFRGESECVVSSRIDFSLDGDVIMHALVTEVYALEGDRWMLLREYMKKYRPVQES